MPNSHYIAILVIVIASVLALGAVSSETAVSAQDASKYDIVLIMTDDQRFDTVKYMPKVNELLVDHGVVFENSFTTTPWCCPSRASMLTGLYSHNHQVLDNTPPDGGAGRLRNSIFAEWLQNQSYRTAYIGKYLNYYHKIAPAIPKGWNEWHVFSNPHGNNGRDGYYDYTLVENGRTVFYPRANENYSTTVFRKKAVKFIEETPSSQGLLLVWAPFAPHAPGTPAPHDQNTLNITPHRPPSYNEQNVSDKPKWVQSLPLISAKKQKPPDRRHESMIESLQEVDRGVADIVDALNRTGRLGNTVIIFTSDNGLAWGEHRWMNLKTCPYEECIRVPLVIRVPGIDNRTEKNMVAGIDLAPSIAEWAGTRPPWKTNGRSLVPLLQDSSTSWRNEILVEELAGLPPERLFSAVRTERYLYAQYKTNETEFYDLQTDPYQLENSVRDPARQPLIKQLNETLQKLKKE